MALSALRERLIVYADLCHYRPNEEEKKTEPNLIKVEKLTELKTKLEEKLKVKLKNP